MWSAARVPKGLTALLAFSEDRKTAYFRIEQFLESDQQRKDVNDAMREVIKASPDHVVLDLSGNPGGSINAAGHLMSYLLRRANRPASKVRLRDTAFYKRGKFTFVSKERRTQSLRAIRQFKRVGRKNGVRTLPYARRSYGNPSFNGRLTLLVGPRTFSAATMVVTTLRKNRRAPTRTVGTAMGGQFEHIMLFCERLLHAPKQWPTHSYPLHLLRSRARQPHLRRRACP